MQVPFLDLKQQGRELAGEILPLWESILLEGAFVGGPFVERFESAFAEACNTRHCIAVANGTDALRFAIIATGLKSGEEVLVPPNTFIATTEAITQAGGTPVFVDVDPVTLTLDPSRLEAAITTKTRGVVPVHLYGQPADMDPILEIANRRGLWVIEDGAQSQLAEYKGRRSGSMGIAAGTSFYPGKNIGACGEAGAVTTNDEGIARQVAMLRNHGQEEKYVHAVEGYNGRCDAMQAAALTVKLKYLPSWVAARQRAAERYRTLLGASRVGLPEIAAGRSHTWHLYVIQVDDRDQVAAGLRARGIGIGFHYPIPLHLQRPYAHLGHTAGAFPVSERHASRLLSLPMFPELTDAQIDYVCEAVLDLAK